MKMPITTIVRMKATGLLLIAILDSNQIRLGRSLAYDFIMIFRVSLILRLADPHEVNAWHEFSALYTPAIFNLARRTGLDRSDAEDVTQEVLFAVASAIARWHPDPQRARFRTWLGRIARNVIVDFFEARSRSLVRSAALQGYTNIDSDAVPCTAPDIDAEWDHEHCKSLFHLAVKRIRQRIDPKTWMAFEMTAIQQIKPCEVAERMGMSVANVYVARSRVTRLLREEVKSLTMEWECGQLRDSATNEDERE
jgi:RNA polymerase sigma-70 factor (ECF subfamily)